MKVLKFGGSSVATADRIKRVKAIVLDTLKNEDKVVVVVSALSGVTDMLLNTARAAKNGEESYREQVDELYYRHRQTAEQLLSPEGMKTFLPFLKEKNRNLENLFNGIFLLKELSPRLLDYVASYGELVSSYIIAMHFKQTIPEATHIDSRTVIRTDDNFMMANVDFEQTNTNIQTQMGGDKGLYVMGGFIASTANEVTTTLGRGGSDYTAAIVAAGLDADELEIWTDVDGVKTSDPRKVKETFSLPEMTYEEAMEMSHFGAKVIHPPTIQPALNKLIPLRIRNTFNPTFPGTLITETTSDDIPVKGVTSIGKITLISVQGSGMIGVTGIAGRLFSALARNKVNIILITQASSEHSITFAIRPTDKTKAINAVNEEFTNEMKLNIIDELEVEDGLSVVAVIGSKMKNTIGVSGNFFQALARNGVNIRAIAQGSSELNISAVINQENETKSLNALHEAFFLSGRKTVNLFIVGTGLISSTLVQQIHQQAAYLKDKLSLEVRLVGLTNTRRMLIDTDGIELDKWEDSLNTNGEIADLAAFIEKMQSLNLSNSIFVDCTASETPIGYYERILKSSISISTPNKIANSSSQADYQKLQFLAKKYKVKFLYETNVGAGLPVISTLTDLLQSGDEVLKIEAVLSGSLSFIFNTFKGDLKFSDIVKEAKERGYTEPDPRDDLSGKDVARKVLILSREIGQSIEMKDIDIENILPQACLDAQTIDDFFAALVANDDFFAQKRDAAAASGKVLRFLATIEPSGASVALKAVDASDPFYGLSGSDNMIVFTTARYKERPLVVKGPGAGAEVTAAGVFAEIIAISNYLS